MKVLKGIGVSKGIAIATAKVEGNISDEITKIVITDVLGEVDRFNVALEKSKENLNKLYEKVLIEAPTEAEIFQIHSMMLEDLDYLDSIIDMIKSEQANAEYAVYKTSIRFSEMFASMDDEYMKARSADVIDISNSIIKILLGADEVSEYDGQYIYVGVDLLPSQTVSMDKSKVMGFVTKEGSNISHSAILARTMGIPSVAGLGEEFSQIIDGETIIVDGFTGHIYIDVDTKTAQEFQNRKEEYEEARRKLQDLKGKESVTLDGIRIEVNANIGNTSDVDFVIENDAEGVGLFRSEFIYMESSDFPSEEVQFEKYKTVLSKMEGKPVIIRTLDLGADKQADYFNIPNEENPAMGYRAVRICLEDTDMFKTQLRALYRASAFGKLLIMVPMITSVDEVLKVREIMAEVRAELDQKGINYDKNVQFGIMIETPASVIVSDLLADHVDFFSIGTNDLTQYTLAADRMNRKVADIYDPANVAVLRMIKTVAENANKKGIWAGICGESAANLDLLKVYLAVGIRELSVNPSAVLDVRKAIRELNVLEVRDEVFKNILKL